jgi:protein-tyrosine phosphatase
MNSKTPVIRKLQNLYLGAMPGRYNPLNDWLSALNENNIREIVCLVPDQEIAIKSAEYAEWKKKNKEFDFYQFPIPDFGIPDEKRKADFRKLAEEISNLNQSGTPVFIHCGAGIGRTVMFAAAALMRGGMTLDEAIRKVNETGSHPETDAQRSFLSYI